MKLTINLPDLLMEEFAHVCHESKLNLETGLRIAIADMIYNHHISKRKIEEFEREEIKDDTSI